MCLRCGEGNEAARAEYSLHWRNSARFRAQGDAVVDVAGGAFMFRGG